MFVEGLSQAARHARAIRFDWLGSRSKVFVFPGSLSRNRFPLSWTMCEQHFGPDARRQGKVSFIDFSCD
jgi:hypothetical protein